MKKGNFRLTCVAQKRGCLSSLLWLLPLLLTLAHMLSPALHDHFLLTKKRCPLGWKSHCREAGTVLPLAP